MDIEVFDGPISVWTWKRAPERFKKLSPHGGDEDWVAFVPDSYKNEWIGWLQPSTPFGVCDVSEHSWTFAMGATTCACACHGKWAGVPSSKWRERL